MKSPQLFFDFVRTLRRRKTQRQRQPWAAKPDPAPHLRRDPLLEKFSEKLLRRCGSRLRPQVVWNRRLRTTAGTACWRTKTVTLNPRLLEIAPHEIQRTLRHELAHLLAQERAGRRRIQAHGSEWQMACADLGIPGETRCHELPFETIRPARKFFYACRACGTRIGRVRPLTRPIACLRCCKKHNGGRYHELFRFVPVETPQRQAA